MIISQRVARSRQVGRLARMTAQPSVASLLAGRMIQVALAVYLLPALLVVLLVGCLGMLVLAGGRLISGPVRELLN
jgi:hypothetical protein